MSLFEMFLSKLLLEKHLSGYQDLFLFPTRGGINNLVVEGQITKCICPNSKKYLSKLQNVFV